MIKKAFTGTLSQVENCEVMSLSFSLLVLNASATYSNLSAYKFWAIEGNLEKNKVVRLMFTNFKISYKVIIKMWYWHADLHTKGIYTEPRNGPQMYSLLIFNTFFFNNQGYISFQLITIVLHLWPLFHVFFNKFWSLLVSFTFNFIVLFSVFSLCGNLQFLFFFN